jgi:hypothetical protein
VDGSIPEDTVRFIVKYIDSVAQLEALLLLRASPAEEWDIRRVAQRLYVTEPDATSILHHLVTSGLVTADGGLFRYSCASVELSSAVTRLAEEYSRQLIPITNLIHSKPRRIRQFADAFRFRKDP